MPARQKSPKRRDCSRQHGAVNRSNRAPAYKNSLRSQLPTKLSDEEREAAIALAYREMVDRPSKQAKLEAWQRLRALVMGRSPKVVARLERERGLSGSS